MANFVRYGERKPGATAQDEEDAKLGEEALPQESYLAALKRIVSTRAIFP
jgi:hypothetical protein